MATIDDRFEIKGMNNQDKPGSKLSEMLEMQKFAGINTIKEYNRLTPEQQQRFQKLYPSNYAKLKRYGIANLNSLVE